MSRRAAIAAVAVVALACFASLILLRGDARAASEATPVAGLPALSFGPLLGARPGMTPAQLSAAWHLKINPDLKPEHGCGVAQVKLHGKNLTVWFASYRFSSVGIRGPARTVAKVGTGSTLAALQRAYGARLHPHLQPYSVPNVYDQYVASQTKPVVNIYFSMRNGKVSGLAWGGDMVFAEEGCA